MFSPRKQDPSKWKFKTCAMYMIRFQGLVSPEANDFGKALEPAQRGPESALLPYVLPKLVTDRPAKAADVE